MLADIFVFGTRIALSQATRDSVMITRLILAAVALAAGTLGGSPWDKAPEKWDQADAYRILQDSPWSPAGTKVDAKSTLHHTDALDGSGKRLARQSQQYEFSPRCGDQPR